jgi:hypothetical protein
MSGLLLFGGGESIDFSPALSQGPKGWGTRVFVDK